MKKSRVKLEALTPIHLGSGTKYNPLEYFTKENRLVRVDFYRICSDPEFKKYRDRVIEAAFEQRKERINDLAPELAERYPLYSIEMNAPIAGSEVREHIKTNMKPYLPGSSLKGSILTALAYDYFKKNPADLNYIMKCIERIRTEQNKWRKNKELEKLGRHIIVKTLDSFAEGKLHSEEKKEKNGFTRWLRISDPEPAPIERLFAGKVSTYPRGPPISMEMIKPGTAFEYEFEPLGKVGVDEILNKVNEFYSAVLKKENEWRTRLGLAELKFGTDKTLIRVGTGSSKVATSLLLLLNDRYPKTRKLVEPGKLSMGWASLCRIA